MILQEHRAAIEALGQEPLPDFKGGGGVTSASASRHAFSESEAPDSQGWAARLFGWLSPGRPRVETTPVGAVPPAPKSGKSQHGNAPASARPRQRGEIREMVKRLIGADRYAFVLLKEAIQEIDDSEAGEAQTVLRKQMALVPFGSVPIMLSDHSFVNTEIGAFYLDRYAVTNRQFQKFVEDGGYDTLEIWPSKIWPSVVRFTDRTGQPGPRDWENSVFPARAADHPVVGICWYEAAAYAQWVGKRLPTAAEWQKAGGWPDQLAGGGCNRYPWGDLFEPARANLAPAQIGGTLPVSALPAGSTPNGIFQMTGNVWEWLEDSLESIPCQPDQSFVPWKPMRRIVGGAFNTYFANEATCHFVTGQGELDRRDNIGFRCAVSADVLRQVPDGGPKTLRR